MRAKRSDFNFECQHTNTHNDDSDDGDDDEVLNILDGTFHLILIQCFVYDDFFWKFVQFPGLMRIRGLPFTAKLLWIYTRARARARNIFVIFDMVLASHRKIIILYTSMPFTCVHVVNWLQFWKLFYELLGSACVVGTFVCAAADGATHNTKSYERTYSSVPQIKFQLNIGTMLMEGNFSCGEQQSAFNMLKSLQKLFHKIFYSASFFLSFHLFNQLFQFRSVFVNLTKPLTFSLFSLLTSKTIREYHWKCVC